MVAPEAPAPPVPTTPEPRLQVRLSPASEAMAVHSAEGAQRALLLEDSTRFDAAGKLWQTLAKTATGDYGKAVVRRLNALAEAELGLAALAANKVADAVKKLRSAVVEQRAEKPQGLPISLADRKSTRLNSSH